MKRWAMILVAAGVLTAGAAEAKQRDPDNCFNPPCPWEKTVQVLVPLEGDKWRPLDGCDDYRPWPRPFPPRPRCPILV